MSVFTGSRRSSDLRIPLLLALTFSTGVVDAVGYLGLDRVFTGNMTGNVVILSMGLTGSGDLPVLGPLIALLAFVAGAAAAGRIFARQPPAWTNRTSAVLATIAALLVVAAATGSAAAGHGLGVLIATACLGIAMGAQAQAARHLSVKDVTTVVVTSTLTGLAADSRLGGGSGQGWRRRTAAIVLLLSGAAVGACLLTYGLWVAIVPAVCATLTVALIGHRRH